MSTRLSIDGLGARYSLLEAVPAIYRSDGFLEQFVDGLDAVLAPTHATVDDLDAYLDPALCPPDFLGWLGGWLGLVVNERWPIHRRRTFVARAVEVYRWRGTRRGIEQAVELYTGVLPEIEENGGITGSADPLGDIPGEAALRLHVIVRTTDGSIAAEMVDRIVAEVKPVHVPHSVEVTA